jgi:hypothetical protein
MVVFGDGNARRKRTHLLVENGPTPWLFWVALISAKGRFQASKVRWPNLTIGAHSRSWSCFSTPSGLRVPGEILIAFGQRKDVPMKVKGRRK